jgi:hypothetical protein
MPFVGQIEIEKVNAHGAPHKKRAEFERREAKSRAYQ